MAGLKTNLPYKTGVNYGSTPKVGWPSGLAVGFYDSVAVLT